MTEQALTLAQSLNAADITYQWHWQLGRLLNQRGQREAALPAYRAAFTGLQSLKQDLVAVSDDLQFSFRDSVEPVYRELVDLLLQPEPQAGLPASPSPPSARLVEARSVLEALQIAELNNFFRTACLEAQQVDLEEVSQTTTAIIYPIILPDRLEIIASLPGQPLRQFTSAVPQADLEQTLLAWRQNLEKRFTAPEGQVLGQQLYRWLIAPMQTALAETHPQTLVFVLDGALRNTPMAALYDGDRYLVEDYAIALSPGLQILGPRPLQSTRLSALLGGLTEPRHGFSALFNVDDEIQTIQALLDSRVLLNQDFTTTALAQQVTNSEQPIVHLATHARVIDPDFRVLEISSDSFYSELGYRHALIETPTEELTLGLTLSHQQNQTRLGLDNIGPFPLTPGADSQGITRVPEVNGTLQLIPFLDAGVAWNVNANLSSGPDTLIGTGLGLLWQQGDNLSLRVDLGVPLVLLAEDSNVLQDSSIYFSVRYTLF